MKVRATEVSARMYLESIVGGREGGGPDGESLVSLRVWSENEHLEHTHPNPCSCLS